jgi:hypothetical protein
MAQKQIFPSPLQTANITAMFEIKDSIGILRIDGWADGDKMMIEALVGDECSNNWIPVVFCCNCMSTSAPSTHMIIPIPGRYRAVLLNRDNLHETDDTHFDGTRIYFDEYVIRHDISQYFQLCC